VNSTLCEPFWQKQESVRRTSFQLTNDSVANTDAKRNSLFLHINEQ
jgi:hypothetical protein